jgi:hypothetical protein
MTNDDAEVIEAMQRFGGSFTQQLARLYQVADAVNRARLRDAFPDYWTSYRRMVTTTVPPEDVP